MFVIAVDYSIANIINNKHVKESEVENIETVQKHQDEAALFISFWEQFSDREGFLLLSEAKSFLMKATRTKTRIMSARLVVSKVAKGSKLIQDIPRISLDFDSCGLRWRNLFPI